MSILLIKVIIIAYGGLTPEMPWGGFKESGFGKECSYLSLDSYTQVKAVTIALS